MIPKTITIEKIIHSGLGLARPQGSPVTLVRRVLPGEEIIAECISKKKQYVSAEPVSIVKKHKERVTPQCPYYARCGGCDFSHASYPLQLEMKREILVDLVSRAFSGSGSSAYLPIEETLPSPRASHYRQRIRLQVDSNGQPGFYHFRSHNIINIRQCLLAEEPINVTLAAIIDEPNAGLLLENSSELELLLNPLAKTVIACIHTKRKLRPSDKKKATQLVRLIPSLESIFFKGPGFPLTGPFAAYGHQNSEKIISYHLPSSSYLQKSITLTWEVGGFSQVNLAQNNRLINLVLELCDLQKDDHVLDLFCGMGNFSLPLALACNSLLGSDSQRSAIRSAQKNAIMAGLSNCTFLVANITQLCQKLEREKRQYDIVILDPPRQGIAGLAGSITKFATKKIIYISCDPATLCRDLTEMTQSGFTIRHIKPVDMFPQTHHIETVVLLER